MSPKNIAKDYDLILDILDGEASDISLSDEEDEYFPEITNRPTSTVSCSKDISSDEDEEEEPFQSETVEPLLKASLPPKKVPSQGRRPTVWRKRDMQNMDVTWTGGPSSNTEDELIEIPTPYEFFKQYFSDELFNIFAYRTNQYAMLTTGQTLDTNAQEIEALIGMHLKMGTLGFPRIRMYWSSKNGTRIPAIADTMPCKRFFKLRNNLHMVDTNERPANNDRLWKVRPLLSAIKNRCMKIDHSEFYCVDEMMIPFTGKLNIKQYIKGKPCPWGIKMYVLSTSEGIVVNILDYQGKTTTISEEYKEFGHGASVVLELVKHLPEGNNIKIAFDNFFTSLPLLRELKNRGILAVGTIRANRTESCPLKNENELKKLGRGAYDFRIDNHEIAVVRWYDNKLVNLASSFLCIGEEIFVKRWRKSEKQYENIKQPEIVQVYNDKMGGVDLVDQLLELYRIFIRARKWTSRVTFHMVDLAVCNSWQEYRKLCKQKDVPNKDICELYAFRDEITEALLKANKRPLTQQQREDLQSTPSAKRPYVPPNPRPGLAVRYDGMAHYPRMINKKNASHCALESCKQRTRVFCSKCDLDLCVRVDNNCFYKFHTKN